MEISLGVKKPEVKDVFFKNSLRQAESLPTQVLQFWGEFTILNLLITFASD